MSFRTLYCGVRLVRGVRNLTKRRVRNLSRDTKYHCMYLPTYSKGPKIRVLKLGNKNTKILLILFPRNAQTHQINR
eukprot:scaffold15512_cov90-Skeletonema_dohrnii-CCMP3373.AAC.3